ncbi:MAG: immunity 22 family protein [Paraglaciecola sp.]|uniref:immunity 22 family protein n=1 Tax=Paraglaciecola sp. TaxID=1920173 RepID=UPI00273FC74A|nr:immunity 22 family protein [Paraglaciecola sp.]MDP5029076.1 immunity 22 family protein [Paraglaciecola sp.]MDP5131181.1 immunity 22 family protein [Paraglaciecola sp.]
MNQENPVMQDNHPVPEKALLFNKKNKVSVWASQYPYADIPDEYFAETFFKNGTRARNRWADNYNIRYFVPSQMETNGAHTGTIDIRTAAGQCSCSSSYIVNLMSKAKKNKMEQVTWVILLFEQEYSVKLSGVDKDEYTTFLGAFNYDALSDSLFESDDPE